MLQCQRYYLFFHIIVHWLERKKSKKIFAIRKNINYIRFQDVEGMTLKQKSH